MTSLLLTLLQLPFYFLLEVIYFITRCRPKKQIRNEHVLITGASQGIGAELAEQLAKMGNTVHCVARNRAKLDKKVEEMRDRGYKAHAYTCDVSKATDVEKLYRDITEAGFTITVLVNNAGVAWGESGGIGDLTLDQLDSSVKTNLTSNMWLVKLFLPKMVELGKGHVINMSSGAGVVPMVRLTDYCATKAGQVQMTHQLQAEFATSGVTFTVVYIPKVRTAMSSTTRANHMPMLSVEDCVKQCIRGMEQKKEEIYVVRKWWASLGLVTFAWLPPPLRDCISVKRLQRLKQ